MECGNLKILHPSYALYKKDVTVSQQVRYGTCTKQLDTVPYQQRLSTHGHRLTYTWAKGYLSRTPVTQNAISCADSLTDGLLGRPTFWPHVFNRFTRHSRTRPCHVVNKCTQVCKNTKYAPSQKDVNPGIGFISVGHQLRDHRKFSQKAHISS